MRHLATVAGILLGLLFIWASGAYFLDMMPESPPPPEGSLPAMFFGALFPSGYMTFVKALELIGGVLVMIPRSRNLGLLVLGPIIVNILAFTIFIMKGGGLDTAMGAFMTAMIVILPLYLLWVERKAWAALVRRPA
jgi:putative oxidoreductase